MQLNTLLAIVALSSSIVSGHAQPQIVFAEKFDGYGQAVNLLAGGDTASLQNCYAGETFGADRDGTSWIPFQALLFQADFTKTAAGSMAVDLIEGTGLPCATNDNPITYAEVPTMTTTNWFGGNVSTDLSDYTLTFQVEIQGVPLKAVHFQISGLDTATASGDMRINTSTVPTGTGFQNISANLGSFKGCELNPSSQQFRITVTVKGADLVSGPVNHEQVIIRNLTLTSDKDPCRTSKGILRQDL
jgi:hypothetical protein